MGALSRREQRQHSRPHSREMFEFADIAENEVLVETICGCWEANMTHALQRKPVDICRQRHEARVVLGNAGVVDF